MSEPHTTATGIPPLEEGQELDATEFRRRYEAMPHVKKAELIDGVVRMPRPVPHTRHGQPHARLTYWLVQYWNADHAWSVGNHCTVRFDLWNEVQPDSVLLIRPECGGQALLIDDYITLAPELVAEVSDDSVGVDLGVKFHLYQRTGVREYIVWRVDDRAIDWFILRAGAFERLHPDGAGVVRSEAFPGLWLNVAALLALDFQGLTTTLQHGLASPEHGAFVAELQRRRAASGG